jgi:hypothetical protein
VVAIGIVMKQQNAVFCITALLASLGCSDNAATRPPVPPSPNTIASQNIESDKKSAHDFGDFSFTIPNGWNLDTRKESDPFLALLLRDATNYFHARAVIFVSLAKLFPTDPNSNEFAERVGEEPERKGLRETWDFDQTSGIVVSSISKYDKKKVVVIYRDDKTYVLIACSREDSDASEALSQIRETWRWTRR